MSGMAAISRETDKLSEKKIIYWSEKQLDSTSKETEIRVEFRIF